MDRKMYTEPEDHMLLSEEDTELEELSDTEYRLNTDNADLDIYDAYMKDIGSVELLSEEETLRLARLSRAGDPDAKNALVQANLRLVVHIAKKYESFGYDRSDLCQDGSIGLMKAVDHFDPERGNRFATCAVPWIRQAITRGIAEKGRSIRLPDHVYESLSAVKRSISRLRQELDRKGIDREPTFREVADDLGKTVAEVEKIFWTEKIMVELDRPIKDGEGSTLGSLIDSGIDVRTEEELFNAEASVIVSDVLSSLSKRHALVLKMRYGLKPYDEPLTLEQIGRHLGITRERVRQIERDALNKLKSNPELLERLRDLL